MVGIIFYLIGLLASTVALIFLDKIITMPEWYGDYLLFIQCCLIGVLGGVLYCLRGVYKNKCVAKNWDVNWHVWYYLRPITSGISGYISCIFLKAGLLALDAGQGSEATNYGYLAIAFIAGYNVDNFLKKIESIAKSVWGINKSRSSNLETSEKKDT